MDEIEIVGGICIESLVACVNESVANSLALCLIASGYLTVLRSIVLTILFHHVYIILTHEPIFQNGNYDNVLSPVNAGRASPRVIGVG